MAWHQSAKKRLRRDAKKQAANKSNISRLRTLGKKALLAIQTDKEKALPSVSLAQSFYAKAASKGLIHKKTAARKTSRLMKRMNQKAI